ncbi:hypothetical protein K501DRAFT_256155 [Backusella circina FSU 941]|nr:hypothetical protein K501DRAFT_256155 [Backusella circina FSU 941]
MEKRALPTRHNFLTEAVQNILEAKIVNNQPILDCSTLLTVTTTDVKRIKGLKDMGEAPTEEPIQIAALPGFKPYKQTQAQKKELEPVLAEEEYMKRHRRLEMEEKKTKNREKERLKHGYYQQKQLVERIKTIERSTLQSIVSSIRHRNIKKDEVIVDDEETYLDNLHQKLLKDAQDLLARYEVLGLSKTLLNEDDDDDDNDDNNIEHHIREELQQDTSTLSALPTVSAFDKALQTEAIKQRERQIQSFNAQPVFAGQQPLSFGSRRSTRHVIAFGQKLPDFDTINEFTLPIDTFNTMIEKRESKQRKGL